MIYKKNTLILLFLTTIFLQSPLECMFGRFTGYVTKQLPTITALLKKRLTKATPAVPAGHVISNVDGSPVSQTQFNEIKTEILRPNEFPTALKNPDYNPDADETKVIQQKLDEKYTNDIYTQRLYDPFHDHPMTDVKKTTV